MRTFENLRSLVLGTAALGLATFAGSLALPASAEAGVSIGVNIGVPGPAFYGTYRIRTGACGVPRYAYNHPYRCGYPRFSEPVFIDGIWINEPLYWRNYGGGRYFWYNGRWARGHGSWDGRVFRGNWRDTWRQRGWDRAEVRDRIQDRMEDRRDNMRDRMQDRREDMRDHMQDRMEDRRDNMRDRMQDKREDMRDRMQDRKDDMKDRDHDNRGH